jgi:hypothetical protein
MSTNCMVTNNTTNLDVSSGKCMSRNCNHLPLCSCPYNNWRHCFMLQELIKITMTDEEYKPWSSSFSNYLKLSSVTRKQNYQKLYLLTTWSRVLLEKLTDLQLSKNFPAFYKTRNFITAFTNATCLYPEQAQSSPNTHILLLEDPS